MKPIAFSIESFPDAPYSYAIKAGEHIYISGQTGLDYTSGKISNNFEMQAKQAFENLAFVLRSAGSRMESVVKTTIWLTDAGYFETVNKLYREYFPNNAPARSTPIVDLPGKDLKISIEAIAIEK